MLTKVRGQRIFVLLSSILFFRTDVGKKISGRKFRKLAWNNAGCSSLLTENSKRRGRGKGKKSSNGSRDFEPWGCTCTVERETFVCSIFLFFLVPTIVFFTSSTFSFFFKWESTIRPGLINSFLPAQEKLVSTTRVSGCFFSVICPLVLSFFIRRSEKSAL